MIVFLEISGLVFIISLCSFNGLIITSALSLFIAAVVMNCVKMWKGQDIINVVSDKAFDNGFRHIKNKKFIKGMAYLLAFPMIVIGILFSSLSLGCMWAMVIK